LLTVTILSAGLVLAAATAHAQIGTVTVKGKWWSGIDTGGGIVSANELKMKCRNVDGHTLDASVQGQRTFSLRFVPDCFIFNDTFEGAAPPEGTFLDFVFSGEEIAVEKNGNPKPFRQLSGVLTAPVFAAGQIQGAIGARTKCLDPADAATCIGEKGVITYSRYQPGPPAVRKVFIGKYKVTFE
jgi:hypothetical protein